MGLLHELLAVEDSLSVTFKKIIEEGIATFSNKDALFSGTTVEQQSKLLKEDPKYVEFSDTAEYLPVAETVPGKLAYIAEHAIRYFDAVYQKDTTNCNAVADLIINGVTIATSVPAVTLLFLENKFGIIRSLLQSIKNLDPAKIWNPDPAQPHIYTTAPTTKPVKDAVEEYIVTVPATDKHPAQTAKVIKQPIVAVRTITQKSGLISSHKKSELLKKCDEIITACKQARQRANTTVVNNVTIASKLFNYLLT